MILVCSLDGLLLTRAFGHNFMRDSVGLVYGPQLLKTEKMTKNVVFIQMKKPDKTRRNSNNFVIAGCF